jgi:hypothetical protein
MRVTIGAGILFTLGALAMSQTTDAQDKKKAVEPKTLTFGNITYDEKVAVQTWSSGLRKGKDTPIYTGHMAPKSVWAKREEVKDRDGTINFRFHLHLTGGVHATPKSILTDAAGDEFEVLEGETCVLAKKLPKKPAPAKKP